MHKIFILVFLLINSFVIFPQETNQKSLAITVYNGDLGVIKDVRSLDLSKGKSRVSITDVAQNIIPATVHIKFDGEVIEQNYQYDLVSLDKILQKYIDKDIQLYSETNEIIEGKLLSGNSAQVVLQKKEGGITMLPDLTKYRFNVNTLPENFITKPTLIWDLNSNKSGNQDVEITYQSRGLSWQAEYVGVLNETDTKLDLKAWVSLNNNSGASYKNASLKLVAGDLNLIQENRQPMYEMPVMTKGVESDRQFVEQSFFEYHIYDLQRQTSLNNNEKKQISLFETSDIPVTKKYLYTNKSNYYYYGNNNNNNKINVVIEFENKAEYGLGMPFPKGVIRMNKSDGKSIEFIGEDMIEHTPKNEKLKLKIGDAFDIVAEEIQKENKRITDKVYEQEYEIKFRNRKEQDVVIEVERFLGLNWEILNSNIKYDKKDAQNVIFQVPVKADKETTLNFKIRYTY
ncbi:MAG: DUF4139 domain-containing protein [Syntrophothermus sp.]